MDKIIAQILEIDEEAQKKIDGARRQEADLAEALEQEKQALLKQLSDRSEEKLRTVYQTEQGAADEQIREIQRRKEELLARLEQSYQEHHTGWEQTLYDRVLHP